MKQEQIARGIEYFNEQAIKRRAKVGSFGDESENDGLYAAFYLSEKNSASGVVSIDLTINVGFVVPSVEYANRTRVPDFRNLEKRIRRNLSRAELKFNPVISVKYEPRGEEGVIIDVKEILTVYGDIHAPSEFSEHYFPKGEGDARLVQVR